MTSSVEAEMLERLLEDMEVETNEPIIRAQLREMLPGELECLWLVSITLGRWALEERQLKLREEIQRERVLDLEQRASGLVEAS